MIKPIFHIIGLVASLIVSIAATFYFFSEINIFIQLLAGIILTSIVIFLLRLVFRKERPNVEGLKKGMLRRLSSRNLSKLKEYFEKVERRTFASAHVARVGVFLSVLYLNNYSFNWTIGLLALMVIIAISRLALKRHRFIDVIIGAAIGMVAGYFAVYAYNLVFF